MRSGSCDTSQTYNEAGSNARHNQLLLYLANPSAISRGSGRNGRGTGFGRDFWSVAGTLSRVATCGGSRGPCDDCGDPNTCPLLHSSLITACKCADEYIVKSRAFRGWERVSPSLHAVDKACRVLLPQVIFYQKEKEEILLFVEQHGISRASR